MLDALYGFLWNSGTVLQNKPDVCWNLDSVKQPKGQFCQLAVSLDGWQGEKGNELVFREHVILSMQK